MKLLSPRHYLFHLCMSNSWHFKGSGFQRFCEWIIEVMKCRIAPLHAEPFANMTFSVAIDRKV